ncbi:MAG TPA: hypothetical protein PJ994_02285 [Tepidiformaceae bacterium]|nr:hypothetical protein [Tepidiformaceae bacterium]HMO96817.1 hypothetical protein [Tepidiformaceae bacterium]
MHPGDVFGYSARAVRDIIATVGDEDGKKIVGGNAVEIWGL